MIPLFNFRGGGRGGARGRGREQTGNEGYQETITFSGIPTMHAFRNEKSMPSAVRERVFKSVTIGGFHADSTGGKTADGMQFKLGADSILRNMEDPPNRVRYDLHKTTATASARNPASISTTYLPQQQERVDAKPTSFDINQPTIRTQEETIRRLEVECEEKTTELSCLQSQIAELNKSIDDLSELNRDSQLKIPPKELMQMTAKKIASLQQTLIKQQEEFKLQEQRLIMKHKEEEQKLTIELEKKHNTALIEIERKLEYKYIVELQFLEEQIVSLREENVSLKSQIAGSSSTIDHTPLSSVQQTRSRFE